jgi:hypothetical protein
MFLPRKLVRRWAVLPFGPYVGKTLPQVVFADPTWFFASVLSGSVFNHLSRDEVEDIWRRATAIRLPWAEFAVEICTDSFSGNFRALRLVPRGTSGSYDFVDLSIAFRCQGGHTGAGSKLLASDVKRILLCGLGRRMTRRRANEFFSCDANFVLPTQVQSSRAPEIRLVGGAPR